MSKRDWEMDHNELWTLYLKMQGVLREALDLLVEIPLGAVHDEIREQLSDARRDVFSKVIALDPSCGDPVRDQVALNKRLDEVETDWKCRDSYPPA